MEEVNVKPKRDYKASMFAMLYEDKEELLALYNAINGTDYKDPDMLEINTLENAIYMSMKNDVSFIIDTRLELYEHQSTFNPNLPLRDLMYLADLYSGYTRQMNLYGTKAVSIPTPRFIVFYNGTKDIPDKMELKLSDLYTIKEDTPALELKVIMYNINKGRNKELLDACKTLKDYAEYTARVREYAEIMEIEEAVERTIEECIQEDILADFLNRNRNEAKKVSIYEYDEQKHMKFVREEGYEDGHKAGYLEGEKKMFVLIKQMILNGDVDQVQNLEDEELRKEMYEKYSKLLNL